MPQRTCSPADADVLRMVARGWTTRRIAAHTSRTPRQVSDQLRAIRGRLGARTNIHAVVIAIRQGAV